MEITRSYYAIIPAEIRYDKDLPPNAKLLYGEITALCNEKGFCWAGNGYFAELYGVTKVTISRWVNQLVEKGYLTSEITYENNSKQIKNRYLRLSTPINKIVNTPIQNCYDPINKNDNTPINKIVKDNNTLINNTINKEINVPASAEDVPPPKKEEYLFLEESTEYKAAIYLRKQILEFNPKCKVPADTVQSLQSWADTIRLIFERDKRSKEELHELIKYIFNHPEGDFWQSNVQSPTSLRKHWDKIYGQMIQARKPKNNKRGKATTLSNMQGRDDWDFEKLAKLDAERRERNFDDIDGLSSDEIKRRLSVVEGGTV